MVYGTPYITFTTSGLSTDGNESIAQGKLFTVTAILTESGNTIESQVIESAINGLLPASESCTITVNVGSTATQESYQLTMQNASPQVTTLFRNIIPFSVESGLASVPCNPCVMFYAGNNGAGYNGDLLHQAESLGASGITNGIQGAYYICQKEAESTGWHPSIPSGNNHTYKAMIVDGVNRVACTSNNCTTRGASEGLNWVLYPGTAYLSESR